MDSEAIYKNFVLRVMAARSPNVRLRKALYRKDSGSDAKCPRTVPAKPSKSRVSRLALISSISKRIVDPKLSKQNATPNAKTKQPSFIAKALTTPQTKKQLSNPDAFRSVRNPNTKATAVSKGRVVAKALVFHSPRKLARPKCSLELNTPVKTLYSGVKKLEITSAKKQVLGYNSPLPPDAAKKQFRGREVKSRVFDGLRSQNPKNQEAKHSKCSKKNDKEKTLKQCHYPVPPAGDENDLIEVGTENKIRNISNVLCSDTEGPSTNVEVSKALLDENKVEASSDTDADGSDSNLLSNSEGKSSEADDKNHTSTSDDKENDNEAIESDDKENASASDDNRESDLEASQHKTLNKNETPKSNQQTTEAKSKQSKENSITAATGSQGLKHKKPKPTNPKPFRLRTDERGILKEANQEKKLHPAPLGETSPVPRVLGGNLQKKCQNALQRNEKCIEQIENCIDTNESSGKEKNNAPINQLQNGTFSLKISKEKVGQKISTPLRHTISSQKKLVDSQQESSPDESGLKLRNKIRRSKSPSIRQLARPQEATPGRKEMISTMRAGQLGTIKETSPTILKAKEAAKPAESRASPATKGSVSPASTPSLMGRRSKTIPREPSFHTIHVPKSCTRRVA
ncbi:hypothetical protein MANES_10G090200v8 [Manihot esculenta]|nr:hypothetical protein MANES_10G090200v8 [Manihot esculenta]